MKNNQLNAILVIAVYAVLLIVSINFLAPFFTSLTAIFKLICIGISLEIIENAIDDIIKMVKSYLDQHKN